MGRKNELGETLRRFRRERGITGGELASHVGVGQGTISKIECGRLVPDLDFLSKFASVLRLKQDDAAAVMRMAGVVVNGITPESVLQYLPVDFLQANWSERRQETVALAEAKSSSIRVFNPLCVPGLLQTERYAREVIKSSGVRGTRSIERAVRARLRRQSVLQIPNKRVSFVLTEAALLAGIGSPDMRAEQIRHLQHLVTGGWVKVGVIPSSASLPLIPPPGFYLFDRRIYIELPHGDLWLLSRSHAYDTYRTLFDVLAQHATFGAGVGTKLDELVTQLTATVKT